MKKCRIFHFHTRSIRSGEGVENKNMQDNVEYVKCAEYQIRQRYVFVTFCELCSQHHLWFYVQVYATVLPWTCLVF
jgi:hypothetical protein